MKNVHTRSTLDTSREPRAPEGVLTCKAARRDFSEGGNDYLMCSGKVCVEADFTQSFVLKLQWSDKRKKYVF